MCRGLHFFPDGFLWKGKDVKAFAQEPLRGDGALVGGRPAPKACAWDAPDEGVRGYTTSGYAISGLQQG